MNVNKRISRYRNPIEAQMPRELPPELLNTNYSLKSEEYVDTSRVEHETLKFVNPMHLLNS